MNLRPPPTTTNIVAMRAWMDELYRYLQFPVFNVIRLTPRTAPTSDDATAEGTIYQDSAGNVLKAHNGTAFTDCNT